jgi:hypothetical protein
VLTVLLEHMAAAMVALAGADLEEQMVLQALGLPHGLLQAVHMAAAAVALKSITKTAPVVMALFALFGVQVERSRQLILEIYNE